MGKSEKLRVAVGCDDDDAVEVALGHGFVEQGNVHKQPFAFGPCLSDKGGPTGADGGMEDMFKFLASFVVPKNKVAELRSVRATGFIARFRPKCTDDCVPDIIVRREQFMDAEVGVKARHGQLLEQVPGES